MSTVQVSPKFQVPIPREILEKFELEPGTELQMYLLDRSIHLHRPSFDQGIARYALEGYR
jgi:AbrB family looped-hinge helix DNA binding protein